jgi:competence protein ComEC
MHTRLTRRLHISWHIAASSIGLLIGTATAPLLPDVFAQGIWIMLAGLAAGCAAWRRYGWLLLVAGVAGFCIGAWRGTNGRIELRVYQPYYGHTMRVEGVLHEDASYGLHGDQRLVLQAIHLGNSPVLAGEIWISTAGKADIKRGDTVVVQGRLDQGFGTLAASMYRATIIAIRRPHPGDMARRFRDWFATGIRRAVPEPQASLGIGYLTGQRSTLPAELDEQLRVVGLTHAVVASGYNLTILVSFARSILVQISKYVATISAAGMVVLFIMITGLSPSMTRAGLVAGIGLLTWYYGRTVHPVVLLSFAMAVTVWVRPAYAWGDLGWCLSFAAFAGVLLLAPLITRYLWAKGHDPPVLLRLIVETVAASATTLPIILYAFGQFPSYALPANLLVLPLVPLTMACTFAGGIVGLAAPGFAPIAGWPATIILRYMTWIVGYIANLPGAQKEIKFGIAQLVASYASLSLLSIYMWRKTRLDFRGNDNMPKII